MITLLLLVRATYMYGVVLHVLHCSILEFGRWHKIKQSPRASSDLCTPLTEGHDPRHPSLALPFLGLALSHHSWFLWSWLDAPLQKFLLTPLSGAPQKCFQSGSALAKTGPGRIGGSRIFLGGAQRRVHPDVYWLHISEDPTARTRSITIHILAKLHSHHYPGLLGRFRSRSGLQNNSGIVLKLI